MSYYERDPQLKNRIDANSDEFMRQVRPVYKLPLDDIEVEIGEDSYGNIYARTGSGASAWLSCVGLERAFAKELLKLAREGVLEEVG